MSSLNIDNLIAEGKKIEHKGSEVIIKPLSVKEQAMASKMMRQGNNEDAGVYMFVKTLKKVWTDTPEDKIEAISDREFITKVSKAIYEVNGFESEEKQNFQDSPAVQEK